MTPYYTSLNKSYNNFINWPDSVYNDLTFVKFNQISVQNIDLICGNLIKFKFKSTSMIGSLDSVLLNAFKLPSTNEDSTMIQQPVLGIQITLYQGC